jgi:molybdopterin/thiamine biosynthesis adenylyltransferase
VSPAGPDGRASAPPLAAPEAQDRYSRLRLIGWWDQKRLAAARVVVVGAGALGNEILKNLALVGVGRIAVIDMDRVELSNLSRSILFRPSDAGAFKAEAAARAVRGINSDCRVLAITANAAYDVGLGIYRWADLIIAGLDNREARLAVNRAAWQAGRPWIDGAIERLQGTARVFAPPDGACYECTMGPADWEMLERRRSCALLRRDEMAEGKVPTTPTASSVVAGIQCQEALKLLHGLPAMAGRGFVFDGQNHDSYMVTYQRKEDCLSHDSFSPVEATSWSARRTTVGEVLNAARERLGPDAVVDLRADIVSALDCPGCGRHDPVFRSAGTMTEKDGLCPGCGAQRAPAFLHSLDGSEGAGDRTLAAAGVPPFDVLAARNGLDRVFWELTADAPEALGELYGE